MLIVEHYHTLSKFFSTLKFCYFLSTELPPSAFIVVPVIYDETILQVDSGEDILYSPEIKFRSCYIAQSEKFSYNFLTLFLRSALFQRQLVDLKNANPVLVIKSEENCDGGLLYLAHQMLFSVLI